MKFLKLYFEVVKLIKGLTTEHAWGAIGFYLDTNSSWNCQVPQSFV